MLIHLHYKLQLKILIALRLEKARSTSFMLDFVKRFIVAPLMKSSLRWRCIFELCYNLIHCPPYVDGTITLQQQGSDYELSIDAYISVIMLGRLYSFARLFDNFAYWTNARAIRVSRINGFLADSGFAIKAYLKYMSQVVLAIGLVASIVILGFEVRVLETFRLPYLPGDPASKFLDPVNSFWMLIVTMATGNLLLYSLCMINGLLVGYGDFYPDTYFGRLSIILAAIFGIFILSMVVNALQNYITLSSKEQEVVLRALLVILLN